MDNPTLSVDLNEFDLDRMLRCIDFYLNVSDEQDHGGRYVKLYQRFDKLRADLKAKPRASGHEIRRMDISKAKARRK